MMARESFKPGERGKSVHNKSTAWVQLDECEVTRVTERAVMIEYLHTTPKGSRTEVEVWVPRSVCHDGDTLVLGDREISVHRWFADKNDLPT